MKPNCPNKQTFIPPSGGNKPANGAQSSKGRNFGGNNTGQKGRPFGKLNYTNVEEVIHSDNAVIVKTRDYDSICGRNDLCDAP